METIWKINLKITLTLLFLIVSSVIAFAAAPVLNSVVGGAQEPDPLDSSLVGYWDMDDRNGTHISDRTSNNNDGLIVDANRSYGKLGWGMEFDVNNSYVNVTTTSFSNSIGTVSAWINMKINNDGDDYTIFSTAPDDGLIGWWDFNGDAKDKSGNENHGANSGADLTTDRKGQSNMAYDFIAGNSDGITIGDKSIFEFGETTSDKPFSVSAWINPDDGATVCEIVSKSNHPNSMEWFFEVNRYSAGQVILWLYDESEAGNNFAYRLFSSAAPAGVWTHVVGTYDGRGGSGADDGMTIYANGGAGGSGARGTYLYMEPTSASVEIGRHPHGAGYCDAKIDDVRIYNRELSATEVIALYNGSIELYKEDDNLIFDVGNSTVNYDVSSWNADEWHHVSGTYAQNRADLYADGSKVASTVNITGELTILDNAYISGLITNFNGTIDEVKIWNNALRPDEIATMYSRSLGAGNITTQNPLAVSVNESSDGDGDTLFTAVDWWKGTELNATTGKPDDNGVVLFMPFDGSTNDYSGYSYDGTATNGAKFTNNSAMGLGAMSFDGVNDYVDTTNAFDETLPKTISLWANKRSQTGPYDGILRLESYLDISSMGGDELMVMYDVSNVEAAGVWIKITSSDPLPLDEWTMITLSLADTSNLDLYINGEYLSTMTYIAGGNAAAGSNTDMLRIGAKGAGATQPFDGLIDEVRIYNRALSPSEISQLYYGRSKGGLVLNQSQTKKDETWNATVTLYDSDFRISTPTNFSFGTITSCGYLAAEGDWNIDGEDGCTLDRNYDLGNNDVTIDGEGIFNLNGFNLTNINKITMRGISATQRLIVRCIQGSCFKQ